MEFFGSRTGRRAGNIRLLRAKSRTIRNRSRFHL